ncbi:MAG: hypothetical protein BroJett024_43350 [Alphaproteobacteria bacterium]|nr:MAG: hypothetical protein BroJett024_43350 [Alphaproteobacteria bacterium]
MKLLLNLRFIAVALIGSAVLAVLMAIPTAIVGNPWFTRMTPVYLDQYIFWIGTSILAGILLATYLGGFRSASAAGGSVGGGLLGYLAIGCPVCNKLIVALLGVSGAMDYFAPAQPFLGALGMLALGVALGYRIRSLRRMECLVDLAA